jgi:hypothetical protein
VIIKDLIVLKGRLCLNRCLFELISSLKVLMMLRTAFGVIVRLKRVPVFCALANLLLIQRMRAGLVVLVHPGGVFLDFLT